MSDDKILKSFAFSIPVELIKAEPKESKDEGEDSWQIQGIASTPDQDLQGEAVLQEGLDISLLKAGKGLFNCDHLKGPENVLGQIEDADFVSFNNKKALMVKGYLFKHQPRAQAFYNILKSIKKGAASRVHLSVEGKILQRDMTNSTVIKKARIDKVALTLDPVNPNTYVDLIKALQEPEVAEVVVPQQNQIVVTFTAEEAEKVLKAMNMKLKKTGEVFNSEEDSESGAPVAVSGVNFKSMTAGAGGTVAPGQMSSGECQSKESLDKDSKDTASNRKKKKKMSKSQVESIIDRIRKSFPDSDPVQVASMVCKAILEKNLKE